MLGIALLIKFVLRPDMSKMINITVEQINKNPLPPMNLQQKIYTGSFVLFLVFALLSICFTARQCYSRVF